MDTVALLRLLQKCTSSGGVSAHSKAAMQELHECERRDGFLRALLEILRTTEESILAFDPNAAPSLGEVRLMAVISIKNLVRRCWNSNRGGDSSQLHSTPSSDQGVESIRFLSDEEKGMLKQYLSSDQVLDRDDKVARQLCSLVGAVAKVDWPQGWPLLMSNILEKLQSLLTMILPLISKSNSSGMSQNEEASLVEAQAYLYKYLCILGETLEILSSKRLPKARRDFQRISVECFGVISNTAGHFIQIFTEMLQLSLARDAQRNEDENGGGPLYAIENSEIRNGDGVGSKSSGDGGLHARSRLLESCGMCAYKWTHILSILLEQGFRDICTAATHPPINIAGSQMNGGLSIGAFIEGYVQCMIRLADVVRDTQLFCAHRDTMAGRGWRSSLRFDLLASTTEDNELLQVSCAEAATGANAGLKAALQIARRVLHLLSESLVDAQKEHPLSFAIFVGLSLESFYAQLSAEYQHPLREVGKVNVSSCPAFVMHATLFISNVLSCREYEQSGRGLHVDLPSGEHRQRLEARISGTSSSDSEAACSGVGAGLPQAVVDIRSFLSPERTAPLLDLVLQQLLPMTSSDLAEWAEDPEEYVLREQSSQEKSSVRAAAESLFLAVLENDWVNPPYIANSGNKDYDNGSNNAFPSNHAAIRYMRQAISAVESSLHSTLSVSQPDAPPPAPPGMEEKDLILWWDSLFLCVGLGSASLAPALHHSSVVQWWLTTLAPLLQRLLLQPAIGSVDGCQILRARLVWLLRCWYYHFEAESHTQVLQLVSAMLDPAHYSDRVVLLGTVKLAETSLEMLQIDVGQLSPMFISLTSLLANLAADLQEPELQSGVVDVLGKLVLSMGRHIEGLLLPFVTHFAQLWHRHTQKQPLSRASTTADSLVDGQGQGQMTLRRSILTTLSMAITAAGDISPACVEALFPVLLASLKGDVELSFLVPEAVDLWRAVMRASFRYCTYGPGWQQLLQAGLGAIFGLETEGTTAAGGGVVSSGRLDEGVDVLAHTCEVLQCYALFGRSACLEGCAAQIAGMYYRTLGTVAPRAVESLTRPLRTFLMLAPTQTTAFLLDSRLADVIFKICAASMSFQDPPVQLRLYLQPHKEDDLALVSYLTIIARVALADLHALQTVVSNIHSELGTATIPAAITNSDNNLPSLPVPAPLPPHGATPSTGASLNQSVTVTISPGPDLLVHGLVRLLIDRFDAVGHSAGGIYSRRLWCLSLLGIFMYSDHNHLVADCPSIISLYTEVLHVAKDLQSELGAQEGAERLEGLPRALAEGAVYPESGGEGMDAFGFDDDDDDICWVVNGGSNDIEALETGRDQNQKDTDGTPEAAVVQAVRALCQEDPVMTTSVPAAAEAMHKAMGPLTWDMK